MAERTVSVRLKAITDQYDQAMSRSQKATEDFGNRAGGAVGRLGAGFVTLGPKLTRNVTLPIVGLGTATVMASANFERSMLRVQGITRATESEFASMSDMARHLGATTQYSASQAADGMGFLAMAGFNANEIVAAMPSTLQLAAAAQMDLARAADITSNILTGYGLEIEELGHANDVLARTMTSTNTDLNMLGDAMKYAAPVARGAGIEFEEAAAAIGLMGNAGIQGSMAGTSLRGALVKLLNPTAQAEAAMNRLGLETKNSDGSLKSLTEIVEQLEKSGASTADIMLIFGQRAGPAMAALVSQGSAALGDLTSELNDADGAAQELADVNMQGLSGGFLLLKSAAEALAISVGEAGLLDVVAKLVRGLADLLQRASELSPELLMIGTGFLILLAAIGPVMTITGKLITNFGHLVTGVKAVGSAATGTVTGIRNMASSLGPMGMAGAAGVAAAGLAIVAYGFIEARQRAAESKARVEGFTRAIEEAGDAAAGTAVQLRSMMDADVARLLNQAEVSVDDLARALQGGSEAWDELRSKLMDAASEAGFAGLKIDAVGNALDSLRREALEAADAQVEIAKASGDASDAASDAAFATDIYGDALDDLGDEASDAKDEIRELISEIDEYLRLAFGSEIAAIRWEDALARLTKQVDENGATLDMSTDAGRRNREAIMDLVGAGGGRIEQLLKEDAATEDLSLQQFLMTEQLKDTLTQLGFNSDGSQHYIDTLAGIPSHVQTTVDIDTSKAHQKVQSLLGTVSGLLGRVSGLGSVIPSLGKLPGRATGGPVTAGQAYWVNENTPNSEIFVPAQPGTIFTQKQFAQMLSGVTGGTVGPTVKVSALTDREAARVGQKIAREIVWAQNAGGVR